MNNLKFDKIWKIIESYNFEENINVKKDILCVLCKKIMTNAHSAPCGCRFCLNCITKYLSGETKTCPGKTEDCKEESLNLNGNIYFDQPMNNKISKLIVKCPEKSCEFKDELRNIENHIRICKFKSFDCPYFNIGCSKNQLNQTTIDDHLQSDNHNHCKLLIDYIDNLKNEIGEMKSNNQNKITGFNDLEFKYENKNREIDLLNEKIKILENKILKMELKEKKQNEFIWKIDDFLEKMDNAKNNNNNKRIFSEPFYSHKNGYKMCLVLYPNGCKNMENTHLGIFFRLMMRDFDDILQWPFKGDVTFDLVNQHTGEVHVSYTERFEDFSKGSGWNKPVTEISTSGQGTNKLIELSELINNKALIQNNRIFIKCSVRI